MSDTPRAIPQIVIGIVGTLVLLGLSWWQLERLYWKEDLMAQLEARLAAEPVALPETPVPARDTYLRVQTSGYFSTRELHVLTTEKPWGPGFRVITPFKTADDGRIIMIDRGFIPEALKDPATRAHLSGKVTVTGALFWPTDGVETPPDGRANIWFSRRVPPMAQALGTLPILIVAEPGPTDAEFPKARRLGANLPNNHLEYAITWFLLALVWAIMSAVWIRKIRNDD